MLALLYIILYICLVIVLINTLMIIDFLYLNETIKKFFLKIFLFLRGKKSYKDSLEIYNKINPIGTVMFPLVSCNNSFTMHMLEEEKKIAISQELKQLNDNKFGAEWVYQEGLGMVRIK